MCPVSTESTFLLFLLIQSFLDNSYHQSNIKTRSISSKENIVFLNFFDKCKPIHKRHKHHKQTQKCIFVSIQRVSHQDVFYKRGVLKNFSKFARRHIYRNLFFNEVGGLQKKYVQYLSFCSKKRKHKNTEQKKTNKQTKKQQQQQQIVVIQVIFYVIFYIKYFHKYVISVQKSVLKASNAQHENLKKLFVILYQKIMVPSIFNFFFCPFTQHRLG